MNQKLTLGISPCPNDTFMFDALVHGKINTNGLAFEVVMADVEELNGMALAGELDITKLSYHAFAHVTESYQLLDAGSALGNNCGPILITKTKLDTEQVSASKIAVPGKFTTANLLFSIAYPEAKNKLQLRFDEIEPAIVNETVDMGVIIHENRFTYREKGLTKILDLGEWWEESTQMPIPLGGIVIKKELPNDIKFQVNQLLRESVEFAFDNPDESSAFIRENAQEMQEEVCRKHIDLYVNDYSIDLGQKGRKAVRLMVEKAQETELVNTTNNDYFLT